MHVQAASLARVARQWLDAPVEFNENIVINTLNKVLQANGFDPLSDDAFIEEGCIEHNLIHIFFDMGQAIVEINPETGIAESR